MDINTQMWSIKISGAVVSSHTLETDALAQKDRYVADGHDVADIELIAPTE